MGMQRPAWTLCFLFVWILVVPGVVLTHLSLVKLLPHISDLPQNIVQGFDETFKFAYLEQDSKAVATAASKALLKCDVNATLECANIKSGTVPVFTPWNKDSNTTTERDTIVLGFQNSLSIVKMVANDTYFGVDELKPTAEKLNQIVVDLEQLNNTMECFKSTPVYCSIYDSAGQIVSGMSEVTQALDTFKNSEIVKRWSEHEDLMVALHALPYFMVLALLCFTCFWMKGAVCCCCREGTVATLALIPFVLFWLVSFVIYTIIFALGVSVKYLADKIPVPVLKTEPNLEQVVEHLQTKYAAFWNLVFADMSDGLDLLFKSSAFIVAVALLIGLYSGCVCCCCPYRSKKAAELKKGEA